MPPTRRGSPAPGNVFRDSETLLKPREQTLRRPIGLIVTASLKHSFQAPGRHWKLINALLILFFLLPSLLIEPSDDPGDYDSANFEILLCIAALVLIPVGQLAWLHRSKFPLIVPAWDRYPFGSRDPLQTSFIGTWCAFAVFASAILLIARFGRRYTWTAAFLGCVFLGSFLAHIVACRVFRSRIQDPRK
jgi:hypothetical protein